MDDFVSKINYQEFWKEFVIMYGKDAIWYFSYLVIFICTLWIIYLYIRHIGLLTTPLERTLKKQEENITKNSELITQLAEMIRLSLETQKSSLTSSQVSIVVDDKILVYKKLFLSEILDIWVHNNIANKDATLRKLKDNFTAIIREEDEKFFKLPCVQQEIIPARLKIKTLELENMYERIYEILLNIHEEKEIVRQAKNLMDNFITNNWRINHN